MGKVSYYHCSNQIIILYILRTCPTEQLRQGFGEKLLLRLLAYRLGLEKASVLKKRALQFGSRIANKNENAHEISQRLL